jgi:hypothetical protein
MELRQCGSAFAAIAVLAMCACSSGGTLAPASNGTTAAVAPATGVRGVDTTPILSQLKKVVVVGTTVDPNNGDEAPRGIAIVAGNHGLQPGDVLVCNFDDKNGTPGAGTTIERFAAASGWNHTSFAQNAALEGCDAVAIDSFNVVFGSAFKAPDIAQYGSTGTLQKVYTKLIHAPYGDSFAQIGKHYTAAYLFIADAATGSILSLSYNRYGTGKITQVATGFAINKQAPPATLGPSGLQYDAAQDVLYIVDGVNNTVVAFSHASNLLVRNEIIVKPGGKRFKCKYPTFTCATLVYAGKPLDGPVASALLPNGNLVVANTLRGNKLVELTPTGQVLDTRIVDAHRTAGVFGLAATGKNDADTSLFFSDTNGNRLVELAH